MTLEVDLSITQLGKPKECSLYCLTLDFRHIKHLIHIALPDFQFGTERISLRSYFTDAVCVSINAER